MTKTIFVTATGTNVGKTYTTLKLMELFAARGLRAVPFKPIETGVEDSPADASKLLQKYKELYNDNTLTIDDVCIYRFALPAAPYIAANGAKIEISFIEEKLQYLKSIADVVLVEGAGGLFVPIGHDYFMIDMAKEFADSAVLVSHTGLGCINDSILSDSALRKSEIPYILVFNRREGDDFDLISKPFFENYFGKVLEIKDLDSLL